MPTKTKNPIETLAEKFGFKLEPDYDDARLKLVKVLGVDLNKPWKPVSAYDRLWLKIQKKLIELQGEWDCHSALDPDDFFRVSAELQVLVRRLIKLRDKGGFLTP